MRRGRIIAPGFVAVTPTPAPIPRPAGLINRMMVADMPAQADGSTAASMMDSAGAVFTLASGAPKYRTGGGKPYIEVADGDRLTLPVASGAGAALQALIATQTFTIITFVENVGANGRRFGTVLGSFGGVNSHLLIEANGARAGFYRNSLLTQDYPWAASAAPLSIAMVADAAYPFRNTTQGYDRLYLNGGCVFSMQQDGTHAIAADGLSLFGIQNGIADGNWSGRYRGHLIYNHALSSTEIRQEIMAESQSMGWALPWAAAPAIYAGFGNSIENGYLSAPEFSPMAIVAATNNWPLGWWDDLGIDGQNLTGMLANASRELYGTAALIGKPHRVMIGEYVNSVTYTAGGTSAQAAQNLATLVANIKGGSANAKVFIETPTNAQTENDNSHANYDPFVTAALAISCDGFVRVDQNATIGRNGDVTNGAYFQPDKLHLVGNAGDSGNRIKAGLMAPVFVA